MANEYELFVEIDFETMSTRHSRTQGLIETKRKFTIMRATHDTLRSDGWDPGPTTVSLFEHTDKGSNPIDPPEANIREELPSELRENFLHRR